MAEKVLYEKEGHVRVITINRPEVYNALDGETMEGLIEAVEACGRDPGARAVVLTGAGTAFCSGGDMKAAQSYLGSDPSEFFRQLTKPLHRLITEMRLLQKPIIAGINGPAGGAGVSLAAACDLRIASDRAVFRQAYTSRGLCPDGGWTVFVPLLVGVGVAEEMLYLDPPIDAQRALQIGLVHKVVPADGFADAVKELASELCDRPTGALGRAKGLLNHSLLGAMEAQMERERQAIIQCGGSEEFREGLAAFLEKRKPRFNVESS